MKNRIIIMAALAMLIWSCDQDGEDQRPDFVSVEDAQAAIQSMNDGFASDIAEMESTKGGNALNDLVDLMNGTSMNLRSIKRNGLSKIESTISNAGNIAAIMSSSEEGSEDGFNFEQSKGVYAWDIEILDFVKTSESSDYVVIHFPTEGSESNNATFKLIEFSEIEIDGFLELEIVVAQLFIDEQLELSIDLEVNYSFLGIPESLNLDLLVAPFELTVDFGLTLQSVSFSTSIVRDETPILSASFIGVFSQDMEEFSSLEVSFSYGTVIALGTMDLEGINNAQFGDDINDFIDVKFYTNQFGVHDESTLLGTVVFAPNEQLDDIVAYIEYTDGTRELLDEAFSGLFMQTGDLFGGV